MGTTSSSSSSHGIGFFGLLTIVFVIFKLLGKIDWPWFWVLFPAILGTTIGIIVLIVVFILFIWADRW